MEPKSTRITYWIATGLLALFILPGIFYINAPFAMEGTRHLGLPAWLHYKVGIGSFMGGLLLIIPKIPARLKEWTYVALGIVYLSAFVAHLSVDGLIAMSFAPIVTFGMLLISYVTYHKLADYKKG